LCDIFVLDLFLSKLNATKDSLLFVDDQHAVFAHQDCHLLIDLHKLRLKESLSKSRILSFKVCKVYGSFADRSCANLHTEMLPPLYITSIPTLPHLFGHVMSLLLEMFVELVIVVDLD
jgi:hypothetical protein